ncbi:hypothetical protein JCM30471_34560 [Desulfuromonas carbonis]|uniref:hypothetical protein n=1 Tax=Desulfuromonas sp. DDH964 TaxID=1823759 RepID=UPI00078CD53C|nr:hypothetical protein [Desulfuromonas sp. DDH964]AMV71930.1 hypothetical protein DBW_1568 [Desulfuromonas sp. DDH964]
MSRYCRLAAPTWPDPAAEPSRQLPALLNDLAALLPDRSSPTRRRLYAAIEALVVDRVAELEAAGIDDECAYQELGSFLDACRQVVATAEPSSRSRASAGGGLFRGPIDAGAPRLSPPGRGPDHRRWAVPGDGREH